MARSSVANYENGQNFPNTDILLKLSEVFNCSVDYLLGKTDVKNDNFIDSDLLKIGLDMKKYTPPTEEQKKQIEDFAKFVLKDNKKD